MITVYNANNLAQQWFFQKAYKHLEAENLLKEEFKNPNGLFLSLESYFANIGTLINLKATYAMIPSDEEPFEINANTRAIKIPNSFAKGVAIAGDDMSEIITFTIDRYFDYVDLAGTDIYVQWILPGENGGTGISKVTLIDLETMPGKIRFGWPLTDKLTQYAGKVNFAVRFLIENKEINEHNPNPYNYVFNTSPATITILPGINIKNPTLLEDSSVEDEFSKFVQNSQNPGLPHADSPYWTDNVGMDLRKQSPAAIDPDTDTLTLKAQALVNGHGYIDYKWYFKEGGLNSENPAQVIKYTTEEENDPRYLVEDRYEEIVVPENGERAINEQYYEQDGGPNNYRLSVESPLDPSKQYYERFTTLTILPTQDDEDIYKQVTGAYWVEALNYVGQDPITDLENLPPINQSTPSKSSYCIVPTPNTITIEEEPERTVFTTGLSSVTLSVNPSIDLGNPARSYTWYKNNNSEIPEDKNDDDIVGTSQDLLLNANENEEIPSGWYFVHIDSQLNRAVTSVESNYAYRVTQNPRITDLITEYCNLTNIKAENIDAYLQNEENWTKVPEEGLTSEIFNKGDLIRLRVRPKVRELLFADDFNGENLYYDEISYSWYIITADGVEPEELNDETISKYSDVNDNNYVKWNTPLTENYLDVWCVSNNIPVISYYCVVTNTLGNRTAVYDSSKQPGKNKVFTIS